WDLSNEHSSITIPLTGRVMANSIGVIRSMALHDQGVALLPTFVCKTELATGDLVRLLPEWHGRADPVHLVYPRQRFMPPKLRAFIDLAHEELGQWFGDEPLPHKKQ